MELHDRPSFCETKSRDSIDDSECRERNSHLESKRLSTKKKMKIKNQKGEGGRSTSA